MVGESATITGRRKHANKASPKKIWQVKSDLEAPRQQGRLQPLTLLMLQPLVIIQISSTIMGQALYLLMLTASSKVSRPRWEEVCLLL